MHHLSILTTIALILLCGTANSQIPNQSTPRNTLEEAFKCARTGNFEYIHLLCDPEGRNDGDVREICEIRTSSRKKQEEFQFLFKLAYSLEVKMITEEAAEVTFKFGPKAQQDETMRLLRHKNKWYLSSF